MPDRVKNRLFYGWVIVVAFLIIGAVTLGARVLESLTQALVEEKDKIVKAAALFLITLNPLLIYIILIK